jgi:NNP family nitrate/nitrite transporter-like MFS transporter
MKLLPLFIFWSLWFLNFSTRTIFSPVLPLIEDTLSLNHGEAGGLFTSLAVGYGLTLLIAGRFASVWGYKNTVATGFIGAGVVFLGLQWTENYLTFHILFFLLGVATGTYLPSILPIITETYDQRHWGKAIGIHDSAASLSIFSIPILVAFGVQFLSWKKLLIIFSLVSFLLPIFFWKVSVEPQNATSQQKGDRIVPLFKRRSLWIIAFLAIFSGGCSLGTYVILPLYLIKERGIGFHLANNLLGVSRIGGVFISILSGFLIDRFGYRMILMLSLLAGGLSTIALSLASSLTQILVTLTLQATLLVAYFPASFTAISNLTPLSDRSMAIGIVISFGVIFGVGFTPLILGLIADHWSFQIGILWLGILTTFCSLSVRLLEKA